MSENSEQLTLTLRKPITLGEGDGALTYTELTLREPLAEELERAYNNVSSNMTASINLISIIAGVPRAVAAKLPQREFRRANEFLGNFSEDGPLTGES